MSFNNDDSRRGFGIFVKIFSVIEFMDRYCYVIYIRYRVM